MRNLKYILILILFVGFFSPISNLNAQSALGTCTTEFGGDAFPRVTTNVPQSSCNQTNQFWAPNDTNGNPNYANQQQGTQGGVLTSLFKLISGDVFAPVLSWIFFLIQKITALIMGWGGLLLNFVINLTVVQMRQHINDIPGINIAWKVVRDLMNIAFIFLLVYYGILVIIGYETTDKIRKFITSLVLAAILINFSLFVTKVLIDASNIVTLGIYTNVIGTPPPNDTNYGLSNKYQEVLGLQGFWSTQSVQLGKGTDNYSYLVANMMSSILFLITAFVFFAVSILFGIRYIVLIVLMALSPVAFMGSALPGVRKWSSQWWNSLWGQLLFAPIFMIMTWIILVLLSNGISGANILDYSQFPKIADTSNVAAVGGSINLLFNFGIVIGLSIISLVVSKKYATQGSEYIKDLSRWATATAGDAVFGGTGWLGRQTLGRTGAYIADNANLQRSAKEDTGIKGAASRLTLYGARQARSGTFDARNATVPTSAVGDLVEGTAGRTRVGKAMGLNDVNIPDIPAAAPLSSLAGTGRGGNKGFVEEQKEKGERIRKQEAANAAELAIAEARQAVIEGAQSTATTAQIDAMEKALSKLSDKQTEALVTSNRELLDSQNFANKISVKQLEALNKSDQLSDDEKDKLKNKRFAEIEAINDGPGLAALAIPAGQRTPIQAEAAKRVETARGRIKGLSDSEIEMLDTSYLSRSEFVSELRPAQVESIIKSNKFTSGQKQAVRNTRLAQLLDALDTSRPNHTANPALVKRMITKGLSVKDVAGLAGTNVTFVNPAGAQVTESILVHPEVLNQYSANMLKRMGQEMSSADIQMIRDAIDTAAQVPNAPQKIQNLRTWINSPDGQSNFS